MIVHSAVAAPSKAVLRRAALARRAALDPATAEHAFSRQGAALADRVKARIAAAYWPVRGEAPTRLLLSALAAAGVTTALPSIASRGADLLFRCWAPGAPTAPDAHGIPGPRATAQLVVPDLVFVPLAAFDRTGQRIGSGAGYYDCALARLRDAGPTLAVGLAFAVQEVDRVPHEPHDQRLDYVITERELIACGQS